jgi:lysophospholipase L1-like esterase
MTKVVAVGGCHIHGYPVGIPGFMSFASRLLRREGVEHSCSLHGTLNLNSIPTIATILREQQPDVLIVQMGNYEFQSDLLRRTRKLIGLSSSPKHSKILMVEHRVATTDPYRIFSPTKIQRLKLMAKHVWVELFGRYLIDVATSSARAKKFFAWLSEQNTKHVVILSPLPAFDQTVQPLRKIGASLFRTLSRKYNFDYIDAMRLVGERKDFFFDNIHLNAYGHELVGQAVAEAIVQKQHYEQESEVYSASYYQEV